MSHPPGQPGPWPPGRSTPPPQGEWQRPDQGWNPPPPPYGPPGPPPRRTSRTGLILGLGGGVVALVVALVLLFVVFRPGGDSDTGDSEESAVQGQNDDGKGGGGNTAPRRKVAWTVPEATSEAEAATLTTYVVGDVFVRASQDSVVGYALDSGEESWRIKPPSGFSRVCAASPTSTGDVVGVVYGSSDDQCGLVAAIDLKTGKQLWHTDAKPGESLASGAAVAAADGRVFGPYPGGSGVYGYDIKAKRSIWDHDLPDETCSVGDVAADENAVLFVVQCVLQGTNELVSLDPTTGDVNWQTELQILYRSRPRRSSA